MYCLWEKGIYLLYNQELEKIVFSKCCGDNNQPLKTYSIEEFESIENLNKEIHSLEGRVPDNFVPASFGGTCWPHSSCNISVFDKKNVIDKVAISLDRYCNATCKFCLVHNKVGNQKMKKLNQLYFETLEKLKKGHWRQIRLTDRGEPGLFKEETIKWIESLSVEDTKNVSITTNGAFLSDDFIKVIEKKKLEGLTFDIIISVNGTNKETRKSVMGLDDFNEVYNKIKYSSEKKIFSFLGVSMVVTYETLSEAEQFVKMFKEIGVEHIDIPFNLETPEIAKNEEYQKALKIINKS